MSPGQGGVWGHLQWDAEPWEGAGGAGGRVGDRQGFPVGALGAAAGGRCAPRCAHSPALPCSPWRQNPKPIRVLIKGLHWLPSVLFCAVTPVPHRNSSSGEVAACGSCGAEQHLVFLQDGAVGSQTFSSSQENLRPPRVAKHPAWQVPKPRPSRPGCRSWRSGLGNPPPGPCQGVMSPWLGSLTLLPLSW